MESIQQYQLSVPNLLAGGPMPKAGYQAVQRENVNTITHLARVQGRAYLAQTALFAVGLLSAEEANLIQAAPLGENRYRLINDSFAIWAAHEVGRL